MKRELTWAVMDDSSSMSVDDVGEVLEAAFEKWAAAAKNKFTFEEVTRDMQVSVHIERYNGEFHRLIDGLNGVLAL